MQSTAPFFASRSKQLAAQAQAEDDSLPDPPRSQPKGCHFAKPNIMPKWLFTHFHSVIFPDITHEGRSSKKMKLFREQSLWWRPPDPVFQLIRSTPNITGYWQHEVFIWQPHLFVQELRCPTCGKRLRLKGASHPRRVYDIKYNWWAWTWRYDCDDKDCTREARSMSGWAPDLMARLPSGLSRMVPIVFTKKAAYSKDLERLVLTCFQSKMGASGVRLLLLELHTAHFDTLGVAYLQSLFESIQHPTDPKSAAQRTLYEILGEQRRAGKDNGIQGLGHFSDLEGYSGCVPSEGYISNIYVKSVETESPSLNQFLAMLPTSGPMAEDHSHKVSVSVSTPHEGSF